MVNHSSFLQEVSHSVLQFPDITTPAPKNDRPKTSIVLSDITSSYPREHYFVLLILIYVARFEGYRCTGSLLKPKWVLTTGNCVTHDRIWARNLIVVGHRGNLNTYLRHRMSSRVDKELRIGNVEERRVMYYRVHPQFDKVRSTHDIALLKLRKPFTIRMTYGIVALDKMTKKVDNCSILGFGILPRTAYYFFDAKVRKISNLTISKPEFGCPSVITKKVGIICFAIPHKNACKGDFGSPLMCNGEIWGISTSTSKRTLPLRENECYGEGENYYTELYPEIKWINSIISKSVITVSFRPFIFVAFSFVLPFLK